MVLAVAIPKLLVDIKEEGEMFQLLKDGNARVCDGDDQVMCEGGVDEVGVGSRPRSSCCVNMLQVKYLDRNQIACSGRHA